MPFGLSNAPSTFMHLMIEVLKSLLRECVVVYFNDILVFSKTRDDHLKDLRKVFFLGLASFYRHFIKQLSSIASPTSGCLIKGPFQWTKEADEVFAY